MKALASLAYAVGWAPKGVPVDKPLMGVPYHLRNALLVLDSACGLEVAWSDAPSGLQARWVQPRHGRAWTPEALAELGSLHPMSKDGGNTLERLLLPYLEAALPEVPDLAVESPTRWRIGSRSITIDLARLEASAPDPTHWGTHQALRVGVLRVWGLAWLQRVLDLAAGSPDEVKITVRGDRPLPILALLDTVDLLEATRRAYGPAGALPPFVIHAPDLSRASLTALHAYGHDRKDDQKQGFLFEAQDENPVPIDDLSAFLLGSSDSPSATSARNLARLATARLAPVSRPHLAIGDFFDLSEDEAPCHWPDDAVVLEAHTASALVGRSISPDYSILDTSTEILDFFFQRFFPYSELRPQQREALRRLLESDSQLVLLPTGYGKSVIYQLAALMQPGVALIVSPLISLVIDQLRNLERVGITAAGALNSRQSAAEKSAAMQSLRAGELRLLYLMPERLQDTGFRRELAEMLTQRRFSFIAADEVHSASQWGHDFRSAYQLLKQVREFMEREGVARVPMAGFTATASPIVRADVLRMLGIPADGTVQSRSSDRPELSFSVHEVDDRKGANARLEKLTEIMQELPPKVVGLSNGLLGKTAEGRYESGAIVFVPFANATLEPFYKNKAPAVSYYLKLAMFDEGEVEAHASQAPSVCPRCSSPRVRNHYGTYHCDDCRWHGKRQDLATTPSWDQHLWAVQDAFLNDELPVLVATNGFGVGIDKPNVRMIFHQVMSGSLEAYYQEAGRAGRDGDHAHIALVTVPPAAKCASTYLNSGRLFDLDPDETVPLPCLELNRNGFPKLKCPYGLTELCDVAQQAYLVNNSFPGAQKERIALINTYAQAVDGAFDVWFNESDMTDAALTRLVSLTVIDSYGKAFRGKKVRYTVRLPNDWSWDEACAEVATYLRELEKMTGTHGTLWKQVESLKGKDGEAGEFVQAAGSTLIDAAYTVVRATRLMSLHNLYRYTSLKKGECRRVYLRRAFDINPISEDYNCGFCDNCVPSLQFERERAYVPEERSQAHDLSERLDGLFGEYDLDELQKFARDALPQFAGAVRGRTEYMLEQMPNDLSLLFLLAVSSGVAKDVEHCHRIVRRGVEVLQRAGSPVEEWVKFVLAIGQWVADVPSNVMGEVGSAFDGPELRSQLLAALETHSPDMGKRLALSYQLTDLSAVATRARGGLPGQKLRRLVTLLNNATGSGGREDELEAMEAQ